MNVTGLGDMKRRFLIGQLVCYGDCLFATTIAKQIKNDCPDSRITWAVASKYKSILELNPHIDEIWEIPPEYGDYTGEGWNKFEAEAASRRDEGLYDELIFSQLPNRNWHNFDGTIRSSILRSYGKPITVSIEPVLKLSLKEVENVRVFAECNSLNTFKEVILFECMPGSCQSSVNMEFAYEVAKQITDRHRDMCFILSSSVPIRNKTKQIIDASALTFRENAELSKYCSLLIGCASGLTWICSSEWAKKLNTIQIFNKNVFPFVGVAYDHELWHKDGRHIMEIHDESKEILVDVLEVYMKKGFDDARRLYDQNLRLTASSFKMIFNILWTRSREISSFCKVFKNILKVNKNIKFSELLFIFIYSFIAHIVRSLFFPKGSLRYRLAKRFCVTERK